MRFGFSKERNFMSLWQAGAEHELEITGLNHAGAGVGRIDGRVVFVPDSLPGERVHPHYRNEKRYGTGTLLQVWMLRERIEPTCPHAQFCGGCQFQHSTTRRSLSGRAVCAGCPGADWRIRSIRKAYCRHGKAYEYRNNTQHAVGRQAGHMVMGFFRKEATTLLMFQRELQHP